jgi:hypothetical protein
MSLAIVTNQLQQMAAASAVKASRANDPDSIAAARRAEELFRRLTALVQGATVELDAYRTLTTATAPKRRARAGIDALEFWRRHGLAVESIRETYGHNWTIKAPFGETELVTVPACWRSFKTERGTTLTWRRDNRIPAAKYWPDQRLPVGLVITPDYPRASPVDSLVSQWQACAKWFRQSLRSRNIRFMKPYVEEEWEATDLAADLDRVRKARQALKAAGATPGSRAVDVVHDDAWHLAHGYVLSLGQWVSEIGLRASQMHQDAIETKRLAAEQAEADQAEDAEVEGEYAEAAD